MTDNEGTWPALQERSYFRLAAACADLKSDWGIARAVWGELMDVALDILEDRLLAVFGKVFGRPLSANAIVVNETEEWDSLSHIKLIMELESKFDIQIDPGEVQLLYQDFATVRDYLRKMIGRN